MRRFAPLFLAVCLSAPAFAAEPPGPTFTLKDAVALALQHAFSTRIAAYRDASAQAKVGEARLAFVPDLTASASAQGVSSTVNKDFYIYKPAPIGFNEPLPDGPVWRRAIEADVTASYVLISSTRRLDLKSAQFARESQEKSSETARRQVIRDTARAYLQVVQADQLRRLADQDVARRTRHRDEAVALVKAGKRADYETIRADADLASAEATQVEARNSARIARSTLAQTIGTSIPLDLVAEPPAPPVDPRGERQGVSAELIGKSLEKRPDLQAANFDALATRVNVERTGRHYLPTISLLGRYTKYPSASPLFDNLDSSLSFGAQLQWRFSDSLVNFYRDRDARAQARLQDVVADQTRVALSLDVERSMLEVDRATEVAASVAKSLTAAKRNYETASERYRLGVGSQTEQIDAEAALVEAEVNAAKADVGLRTALWNLRYEMGEPLDVL